MRHLTLFACLIALSQSSCSLFVDKVTIEQPKNELPPNLETNPLLASGGDVAGDNYNVTTSEELAKIDNGAEGEVFFTNPDDPDQEIGGITAAFENKRQGQFWFSNYGAGLKQSRELGLPALIWFHDSSISPKSKTLGVELLNTKEFLDWAKDKAVCICLDSGSGMQGDVSDATSRTSSRFINQIQYRYKLRKKPAFVIVTPNGETTHSIDGFDGFIAGFTIELKGAITQANEKFSDYKENLKKKGYRTWRSSDGEHELFAKVTRFDQKKDMLYLLEYTGKQKRIHESKFSNDDIDYVENNLRKGGPKY